MLVGIFFTFAAAAYWLFERDRAIDLVTSFMPRPKRKTVRDTWELIDLKLGAFVRGQLILIGFVSTVVSLAFWLDRRAVLAAARDRGRHPRDHPGRRAAARISCSVAAGLTVDWQTAAIAGGALLGIRLFQDYVVNPRVMGGAVGLSPLIVMVSRSRSRRCSDRFYVLLSVPIASLIVDVLDVVALRKSTPPRQEVPTVLFPAGDSET